MTITLNQETPQTFMGMDYRMDNGVAYIHLGHNFDSVMKELGIPPGHQRAPQKIRGDGIRLSQPFTGVVWYEFNVETRELAVMPFTSTVNHVEQGAQFVIRQIKQLKKSANRRRILGGKV